MHKIIYKKGAKELNMIEKRFCEFMIHQLGPLDSRVIQSHHSKQGSTPQRHSIEQTTVREVCHYSP